MTDTAVEPVVPGSLRDTIRKEIDGYLRDPLIFPPEFVSWIPQRVEQVGIITPQSNVIGSYTTADSLSGLGKPVHGKTCMLRVGSTPYHFLQLTYDETYGKWVSSVVFTSTLGNFNFGTTAGVWTSPTEATTFHRQPIAGFKALYDAGARPQVHIMAQLTAGASGGLTHSIRAAILEFDNGDTSPTKIAHGNGQVDWVGSGLTWRSSSTWSDVTFSSVPARAEALLGFQYDTDGSGTFSHVSPMLRWVANPV